MKQNREENSTVIYSGSDWQANMVKSLLEAADIKAFIKDGHMGTIAPFHFMGSNTGAVKVLILEKDINRAKEIIEKYEQNRSDN
ncbi:MAG: DUF2007-related protein [Bacteroidales bacterium]|nr:DUF2007-related protein [Bacteroidales bacterium]MDD4656654.1 DUF2007-related protein [Bacteroidales bacterium]